VPTQGRALVLRGLPIGEEQGELECVRQPDDLEFGGCRESLGRVAPIERSAKTMVGRALRGHEQMFARRSRGSGLSAEQSRYDSPEQLAGERWPLSVLVGKMGAPRFA
jgi:hypothetical protein